MVLLRQDLRLLKLGGGLLSLPATVSPLPPSFCEPSGEPDSTSLEHLDRRPQSTVFLRSNRERHFHRRTDSLKESGRASIKWSVRHAYALLRSFVSPDLAL